jgi:hypothetical protein
VRWSGEIATGVYYIECVLSADVAGVEGDAAIEALAMIVLILIKKQKKQR